MAQRQLKLFRDRVIDTVIIQNCKVICRYGSLPGLNPIPIFGSRPDLFLLARTWKWNPNDGVELDSNPVEINGRLKIRRLFN